MNYIEVINFEKKFKNNKVGPFSFDISKGKITALLGSSGSGKTVLINAIIGATKKFKGKIKVDKFYRKKNNNYLANNEIGFYTQMDFSLYDMSAYKFLKNICQIFGLKGKNIAESIEYWMQYFDLWENRNKKLKDFSWGMKNRMNLVLCFIKDPNLIIMDEPGANLDSYWREKLKKILIDKVNQNKTVIITVHNIDEIVDIIDHFIIIDKGRMVFNGTKDELNLYKKYKVVLSDKFNEVETKKYFDGHQMKTLKYNSNENSFIVVVEEHKKINYVFLYAMTINVPITKMDRLPINMESIHKALEARK